MAALYRHFFRISESEQSCMLEQISKRKSDNNDLARVDYQKLRRQHKCPWPRYSHVTHTQVTKFTHQKTERRPFLNIPTHKIRTLDQQDATLLTWSEQSVSFLDHNTAIILTYKRGHRNRNDRCSKHTLRNECHVTPPPSTIRGMNATWPHFHCRQPQHSNSNSFLRRLQYIPFYKLPLLVTWNVS
jgi:hypothetical protein